MNVHITSDKLGNTVFIDNQPLNCLTKVEFSMGPKGSPSVVLHLDPDSLTVDAYGVLNDSVKREYPGVANCPVCGGLFTDKSGVATVHDDDGQEVSLFVHGVEVARCSAYHVWVYRSHESSRFQPGKVFGKPIRPEDFRRYVDFVRSDVEGFLHE